MRVVENESFVYIRSSSKLEFFEFIFCVLLQVLEMEKKKLLRFTVKKKLWTMKAIWSV
jgi:hypothetical protein